MSKTLITQDMVEPGSPLLGGYILDGEDRIRVNPISDDISIKSIRIPMSLYDAAMKLGHSNGFSGVVRDALHAYLEKPSVEDVENALAVIRRAIYAKQNKAA